MGKPPKKTPAADNSKQATGLSLDLGLGVNKKPRGGTAALQPKKLVDSKGNTTIEGLKQNLEFMVTDLLSKIDKNTASIVGKVAEAEAVVHKQAKADHAKTCQVPLIPCYVACHLHQQYQIMLHCLNGSITSELTLVNVQGRPCNKQVSLLDSDELLAGS